MARYCVPILRVKRGGTQYSIARHGRKNKHKSRAMRALWQISRCNDSSFHNIFRLANSHTFQRPLLIVVCGMQTKEQGVDRDEWKRVLNAVKRAAGIVAAQERPQRLRFADWLITAMFLWAVAHDRPPSWSCDRRHYSGVFRPRKLPSVSQFNRRMNCPRMHRVLLLVHEAMAGPLSATALSYLDGKPLLVGVASKDPDAAKGHVMGGFGKGYKLHAWMTEDRRIPLWCVLPLNVHEVKAARALVEQAPRFSDRALVLVDQNYDSHDLHTLLVERNVRLLVKPKGDSSGERHAVTLRQMGEARRELLAVQRSRPDLIRMVLRHRIHAEGTLGNLCSYGGGLTCLPPWVRRLHRVRRWVGGKIILYHTRLRARVALKPAA
jgi:hypothetical protein